MGDFGGGEPVQYSAGELTGRVIGACGCVLMSAFFAGLTLGLMGLDVDELELLKDHGTEREKRCAATILPIRRQGNLLLCTLVYGNVAATALLSILLSGMTNGLTGFLVSTFVIVVFGEIIPQTVCNRMGLEIGARLAPIVYVVGAVLLPVTYPIAYVLDAAMGEESGISYNRNQLRGLVEMQVRNNNLDNKEGKMVSAILKAKTTPVGEVMTPLGEVFSLRASQKLDLGLMTSICNEGFSRIPVFSDDDGSLCLGLLYSKDLVLVRPEDCLPVIYVVQFFNRKEVEVVLDTDTVNDTLDLFTEKRLHFALVNRVQEHGGKDSTYARVGLVTMEDILEYLLARSIEDEHDGEPAPPPNPPPPPLPLPLPLVLPLPPPLPLPPQPPPPLPPRTPAWGGTLRRPPCLPGAALKRAPLRRTCWPMCTPFPRGALPQGTFRRRCA